MAVKCTCDDVQQRSNVYHEHVPQPVIATSVEG